MNSAIAVQQQRPAASWIYTGFIAAEIIGFVSFSSPFVSLTALAMFLVAGVWAYLERGRDCVLDTHHQFQIRTFWINFVAALALPFFFFAMVFAGVGSLLMWDSNPTALVFSVLVGTFLPMVIGLGLAIWTIIRSVVGLSRLKDGRPIDNPTTWMV
jgi:uncharacterized membrane protein